MKFDGMLRIAMTAGMSLAIGLGATACSRDYTAAYVYSASNSNGTISGFAVDYETGILTQLSGSPFTTQFTNPITIVASPDNKYVYLIQPAPISTSPIPTRMASRRLHRARAGSRFSQSPQAPAAPMPEALELRSM